MSVAKHVTIGEARQLGETLGVNWSHFGAEQFRMGLNVELEHGLHDPSTDVTCDDPI